MKQLVLVLALIIAACSKADVQKIQLSNTIDTITLVKNGDAKDTTIALKLSFLLDNSSDPKPFSLRVKLAKRFDAMNKLILDDTEINFDSTDFPANAEFSKKVVKDISVIITPNADFKGVEKIFIELDSSDSATKDVAVFIESSFKTITLQPDDAPEKAEAFTQSFKDTAQMIHQDSVFVSIGKQTFKAILLKREPVSGNPYRILIQNDDSTCKSILPDDDAALADKQKCIVISESFDAGLSENNFSFISFNLLKKLADAGTKDTTLLLQSQAITKAFTDDYFLDKTKDPSNTPKLDLSFYTDFNGVEDDRANGLYQLELGFKFPINNKLPKKFKDIPTDVDKKRYIQLFRSFYASANFQNLSNLLSADDVNNSSPLVSSDDKSSFIKVDSTVNDSGMVSSRDTTFSKRKYLNSFNLYQWSTFTGAIRLNLVALRWPNHNLYVDYGFGLLRTPVYDSIADKRIHVSGIMHGPGVFYQTHFKIGNPLFNIRVKANLYFLSLRSNDLQQINAPVFDYNNQSPNRDLMHEVSKAQIGETSFRIAYLYNNDLKNTAQGNQVFFRVGYSWQAPQVKGVRVQNDNFQIQLGGLFDLGKIFKTPASPEAASDPAASK